MKPGILFIISAPSGAGKTRLVKALVEADAGLAVSISYTTRPRRAEETDAVDYFFVDKATFETMISEGVFLEHAQVFGNYYGTAQHTVCAELEAGRHVLLEIDWQGARQIRQNAPRSVSIFVLPPSIRALSERLRGRGMDDPETIARRMREAVSEISHFDEYDYVVVNDVFDEALANLKAIVRASGLSRHLHAETCAREVAAILAKAKDFC